MVDWKGAWLARTVVALLALAMVSPSQAFAAEPEGDGLATGFWKASAYGNGNGVIKSQGLKISWAVEIPAQFEFRVTGVGKAKGKWRYQGQAKNVVTGRFRGQKVTGTADLAISGGGRVAGSRKKLRLTGTGRQKGDMVLAARQGSTTFDVSQTNKISTLKLAVTATSCDEAYGEWNQTLKQGLERQGFKASATGYWMGFRDNEPFRKKASELLASAKAGSSDTTLRSPLLKIAAGLIVEYNTLTRRFPKWEQRDVDDLFKRTESILNSLRNLSQCTRQLVGEDTFRSFFNGLTFILQNLIIGEALFEAASGEQWQVLLQGALRSGAIGAGAPNPESASQAEQGLIQMAEQILSDNLDPEDGTLMANDETRTVIAAAAAMGWELKVGDSTVDARELMASSGQELVLTP